MAEEAMSGDIYTLTDEDGKEEEFELLASCTYEGKEYYALTPVGEETDEYVILRVEEEDGEPIFVTIDDDEELENVYQALMDLIYEDEEEES